MTKNESLRVLLIEDSEEDAELIWIALQEGGSSVTLSRVETEGGMRDAMRTGVWDVVVSDFNLPRFSAYEALALLRRVDEELPFIVVSGGIGEENVVSLMKKGVSDFVMKDKLARLLPVIEHALIVAHDRREHRLAMQLLWEDEKLLSGMTQVLGEGLLVMDVAGRPRMMNPEAERLLGWTMKELQQKNAFDVISLPEGSEGGDDFSVLLVELQRNGTYRSEERMFKCRDGTVMPVSLAASAILDEGVVTAVVLSFRDISQRKKNEQDLQESREQLRELSMHLQSVREEERSRIARELHDGLGQLLAAIKLDAAYVAAHLSGGDRALIGKAGSMVCRIDETVEAMRRMAANLRPVMLDDLGLSAALEWLAEDVSEHSGLVIRLLNDMQELEDDLADEVKTALYRITQESLTNVVRHARASNALISLSCFDGKVRLLVSDDGVGLATEQDRPVGGRTKSYGMIGMRERAIALQGEFNLNSIAGEGVTLEVAIPLARALNRRQQ